jgi:peroxiredoxin
MAKMKKCPVCGQAIKLENLEKHVKKVHPREKVDMDYSEKEERSLVAHKQRNKELSKPVGLWKVAVLVIVVAALVGGVFLFTPSNPGGSGEIKVGTPIDDLDFEVIDTDGNYVKLSDLNGEVVLLDFMQSTCHFCQENTRDTLVPIYQNYNTKITMLSVSIRAADTNEDLIKFKNDYSAQWSFSLDTAGAASMWGITGTPTSFLIDSNGVVQYKHTGVDTYARLSTEIDALIS